MFPQKVTDSITKIRTYFLLHYFITLFFIVVLFSININNSLSFTSEEDLAVNLFLLSLVSFIGFLFFIYGSYYFTKILARKADKNRIKYLSRNFLLYSILSIPKELGIFIGLSNFMYYQDFTQFIFVKYGNMYILIAIIIVQIFYYYNTRNYEDFFAILSNRLEIKNSSIVSKTALIELTGYFLLLISHIIYMTIHKTFEIEDYDPRQTIFYETFNISFVDLILSLNNLIIFLALLLIFSIYFLRVINGYKLRKNLSLVFQNHIYQ